ncbi:hypothetical protein KUTeg_019374 [Tegillarca granosa]|uniref:VWFA domain-containing protein n=1 Tax=Tegillarca granosa TaxID=220873 RepID=A0ABQ9ECB9_TEGGR|nr:hypothetical protein KUTeg_019374 [Tegillarca granosa]
MLLTTSSTWVAELTPADGINYMTNQMFSLNSGARSNVPRIAIVVTDGRSSNPTATAMAADKARQANIALMAVGVGNGVDINELNSIADHNTQTFTVTDFDQLQSLTASIIQKACQVRSTVPSLTTSVPVILEDNLFSKSDGYDTSTNFEFLSNKDIQYLNMAGNS